MSDTKNIKDKLDIVDLVKEYVEIKPAGINLKGCCPFHNEKTPSFMVNPERQIFKCFGCGKSGDIFSFFQEIEGVEFVEALKILAEKTGVELSRQGSSVNTNQKNRIKDINKAAAKFFHNVLIRLPVAQEARKYLSNRGLTEETINNWQIGFIPDQWDLLTKYLLKKGHAIDDLVAAGLTIKRDNADPRSGRGYYDRFRARIMFPIKDLHGNFVGFTGRVLVETEKSGGKYVNTPQTIVYDKSKILFGLDKAKQFIKEKKLAVIVEGQMDVIASHQVGMKNVVASSGTALTDHQVKLLSRYTNDIAMAFDTDDAGQAAAKRGISIALEQGLYVKVIQIREEDGKDPDECIKKDPKAWFSAVENAVDVMKWYVEKAFKNSNNPTSREKQAIADEILPDIARIPYAIEKDFWLQEVASRLQVNIEVLREDLKRLGKPKDSVKKLVLEEKKQILEKKSPNENRIEQLLTLIVFFPEILPELSQKLSLITIPKNSKYKTLYETIKNAYTNGNQLVLEKISSHVSEPDSINPIDSLLMQAEWEFSDIKAKEAKERANALIIVIYQDRQKQERMQLQKELAKAESAGDKNMVEKLMKQLAELMK